ncbi:MAG: hypothetical protein EXR79_01380 [Myxococcales bacterium]|nr:hypothetical protein [Myxococcales bacterium]
MLAMAAVLGLATGAALGLTLDRWRPWLTSGVATLPLALPTVGLELKFKHLQKLRDRRQAWRESGGRTAGSNGNVPATLRYEGRSFPAEVALHGGIESETRHDGLGRLRIHLAAAGDVGGMRRFVVDDPQRPDLLRERVLAEALRMMGLPAPRATAALLEIDAKAAGAVVLVEVPEPAALGTRSGAVLLGWDPTPVAGAPADAWTWGDPADLEPRAEGVAGSVVQGPSWLRGRALLLGLASGQLPPELAVDITATALTLAVAEAAGLPEAMDWSNARWLLGSGDVGLLPIVRPQPADTGRSATAGRLVERLLASGTFRTTFAAARTVVATALREPARLEALARRVAGALPGVDLAVLHRETLALRARALSIAAHSDTLRLHESTPGPRGVAP